MTLVLAWDSHGRAGAAMLSSGLVRALTQSIIMTSVPTESLLPACGGSIVALHAMLLRNSDAVTFVSAVPVVSTMIQSNILEEVHTSCFVLWPFLFASAPSTPAAFALVCMLVACRWAGNHHMY